MRGAIKSREAIRISRGSSKVGYKADLGTPCERAESFTTFLRALLLTEGIDGKMPKSFLIKLLNLGLNKAMQSKRCRLITCQTQSSLCVKTEHARHEPRKACQLECELCSVDMNACILGQTCRLLASLLNTCV